MGKSGKRPVKSNYTGSCGINTNSASEDVKETANCVITVSAHEEVEETAASEITIPSTSLQAPQTASLGFKRETNLLEKLL